MSDTSNLSINISARDTAAAQIRGLQATIRDLEKEIKRAAQTGLDTGGAYVAVLQKQSAAIREQITALQGQASAIRQVTEATTAQGEAAAVVHRTLQQNIDIGLGAGADREIKSAAASARVLAMSLSAAAEADARLRDSELATASATRAATEAMAAQGKAAVASAAERDIGAVGGGGAGLLQRESRHIVGLFDSLARGQRGQAFSSIGAAARDAGIGVTGLATSIGGLIAVMGAAAIMRHAETLGKWAVAMQAAAGATGMSISEYTALAGAMQQLGFSSGEADASMRRMARSLSTALSQPASLAAEAFHNLGISQEQLVANGNNVNGILHMLADAYVRTADGANKTANMEELLGRSFEHLIPLLQNGGAGLDEMTAKQKELGTTLDQDGAQKLAKMGEAVRQLGTSIRGEGITAMEDWSGVIITLSHALQGLGSLLSYVVDGLGKLGSAMVTPGVHDIYDPALTKKLQDYGAQQSGKITGDVGTYEPPFTPAATAAKPAAAAKAAVPALTPPVTPLEAMRLHMAQAAETASRGAGSAQQARMAEARAEIAAMQHTLQTAQLTSQQRVQIETELAQKQIELANEGRSTAASAVKQSYADFAAAERLKVTTADNNMAKITAIYDEWLSAAEGRYKQHASVIEAIEKQKTQAINTARLQQIKQGAALEEQMSGAGAVLTQARVSVQQHAQSPTGQPSSADVAKNVAELAAQAGQIRAAAQDEVQSLMQVMQAAKQGSATQRAAAHEMLSVVTRAKEQEIALYNKAATATQEAAKRALAPIEHLSKQVTSSFQGLTDSLVKDILAPKVDLIKQGLTTIKVNERGTQLHAVFQRFALSMVTDATNTLESAVSKFAAKSLSSMLNIPLSGGSGMGGLLTGGISKLFGMGGQAGSGINAAQFGMATTQLQTAATQLQVAATALQTGAATSSVAGAASGAESAAGSVSSIVGPLTQTMQSSSALDTATQIAVGASSNTTATQNTTLLGGIIQAGDILITALLSALNIKPSFLGFTYSQGGIVPSAAGGMVVGGNGASLSILHAQEMVLPAHLSRGIQGMIQQGNARNGGNQANLHYAPTINTGNRGGRSGTGMTRAEFAQTMASHGGRMMGEARNMVRSGWRPG